MSGSSYMLVADVGNTSIKIGFVMLDNDVQVPVISCYTLSTSSMYSPDSLGLQLMGMLRNEKVEPAQIVHCSISSVVPDLTIAFRVACQRFFNIQMRIFPEDFNTGIENKYARPDEVGADRILASFSARTLFPEYAGLICIDFGTATTFDCVAHNAYLGGLICPGVLTSHRALSDAAAKLPRISLEIEDEAPVIGLNTATCINHGFVFGFVSMTDGICDRLKEQLPQPLGVIATGGFSQYVTKFGKNINHCVPDLLLKGLQIATLNNCKE